MFDNEPGGKFLPKTKVCANCKSDWREGDKYCRHCGAPLDQPGYIVKEFYTIYGPRPIERKHICTACGYTWKTCLMVDNENYCPKCGSKVLIESEEEDHESGYRKLNIIDIPPLNDQEEDSSGEDTPEQ